jgi:hypothetical protein
MRLIMKTALLTVSLLGTILLIGTARDSGISLDCSNPDPVFTRVLNLEKEIDHLRAQLIETESLKVDQLEIATLRAKRIELVDDDGKVWISLHASNTGGRILLKDRGHEGFSFTLANGRLTFGDQRKGTSIVLNPSGVYGPEISVSTEKKTNSINHTGMVQKR